MKYLAFLAINLLIATALFAQLSPDTIWTRTYGGSGHDHANSIIQTTDGGYVVAGITHLVVGDYWYHGYVVRMDAQGNSLWTRDYPGDDWVQLDCIQQTTEGGFVFAGTNIFDYPNTQETFYVVKTDGQGNTSWIRNYGGSPGIGWYAKSIQQTTDGGYILAGYSSPLNGSVSHAGAHIVKIDEQGNELWTHTYGGDADNWFMSIMQTEDEGYIAAGFTNSFGAGNHDVYLVKTNAQGDTLWTRTYGGLGDEECNSIQKTNDGGFVIVGYTNSTGSGSYDFYIVKTNLQGDTLWTRTYGGTGNDLAYSIQQTINGHYIISGQSNSFGVGDYDMYVIGTDGQGNTLWTSLYGGSGDEGANSVQKTTDGGYVMAGFTSSFGAGNYDVYVVKTGPEQCSSLIPATPQVVITTVGEDAHLNWQPVTQSIGGCPITVTRYLVFYSPTSEGPYYYHGYTTGTSYVHLGVISYATGMFYQVRAFVGAPALVDAIERGTSLEEVMDKLQTSN